jgi:hypothetical protein
MQTGKTGSTLFVVAVIMTAGCDDLSSFSTSEDEVYTGSIVQAEEVRKGFDKLTFMELTLNIAEIDNQPGILQVTSRNESGAEEVLFDNAELRPIQSMKYDSLSSLDFPTGRLKNYILSATLTGGLHAGTDAFIVLSLMSDGNVEVRIISGEERLYGIFSLSKEKR